MAIQAYFGLPGSGKSYNAVANVIVPALQKGRTVVTNVPLKKGAIFDDIESGNIITLPKMNSGDVHKYLKMDLYPPGSVYVIDECFSLFPTGQKANTVPVTLKEFFSMHRHVVGVDGRASDIYLMAQNLPQLAAWLREMLQSMVVHTNLKPSGFADQFRCDFYQFELDGTRLKQRFIRSSLGKFKEPYVNYYVSNSLTEDGINGDVLEEIIDTRTSLYGAHKKNLIFASIALAISLIMMAFLLSSMMGDESEEDTQQEETPVNTPADSPADKTEKVPLAPAKKSFRQVAAPFEKFPIRHYRKPLFQQLPASEEWRLTGIIRGQHHTVAMLRSRDASLSIDLLSNCFYSKALRNWACWFQDELVAHHTGPNFDYPDDSSEDFSDALPSFGL